MPGNVRAVNQIAAIRENLRKLHGQRYARVAIARQVGVTDKSLERWEAGAQVPSVVYALRLARALGVTVEQLGFREADPK